MIRWLMNMKRLLLANLERISLEKEGTKQRKKIDDIIDNYHISFISLDQEI